jgi:hypothetical protein
MRLKEREGGRKEAKINVLVPAIIYIKMLPRICPAFTYFVPFLIEEAEISANWPQNGPPVWVAKFHAVLLMAVVPSLDH